jgi:uncharacterized RDD family membrane protein YckC
MASVAVNTSLNVNIDFELAGIDKRLLAWLIDLVVRIVYIWIAAGLFRPQFEEDAFYVLWSFCISLPVAFYFLLFELLMNGQTPGKKIFGIKVISLNGYKPTHIQYLNRWILRSIDTGLLTLAGMLILFRHWFGGLYSIIFLLSNLISLIYILNSKKEQRIGDVIANTVVIRLRSKTRIEDTIFTTIEETNYIVRYPNVIKLSDRDISIIKNALNNAHRTNRYEILWNIVTKLEPVINAPVGDDPYYFLVTLIKDYNYLTTR